MGLSKEAVAAIEVLGAEAAKQKFDQVGAAGKKAGKDISDAFKDAGKALAAFGSSAVDAVVDVKALDPAALMRTFEDYGRTVTKTSIATGQSLDGLKQKYSQLAHANGVLPQAVDAFAKSVGRMTYDIKGGIDAFTGLHNAAIAFGETDQEQVGFASYLKNVQGVAGDTTQAVGKLFAQAEKLGTVGGARALRDLFVSMGGAVDQLVSRMGNARAQTEALEAVLTKGATGPQAQRIAGGALGFLGSSPLDIQRTLGKPLFDKEGRYKDPTGVYQGLYDLMRKPASEGGRGMDDERILLAFQSNLGMEAGTRMYHALKSGQLGQARGLAKIGPSGTAAKAGAAYLASPIGQIDQSRVGIFESQMAAVSPLFDLKSSISGFVGDHPYASLGMAYGLKTALAKGLPKLLPKLLPRLFTGAVGTGLGIVGASGLGDIFLPQALQTTSSAGSGSEMSSAPLADLIFGRYHNGADSGTPTPLSAFGDRGVDMGKGETALRERGMNPGGMTREELIEALKAALESATVKTQSVEGPAAAVEAGKDRASRN